MNVEDRAGPLVVKVWVVLAVFLVGIMATGAFFAWKVRERNSVMIVPGERIGPIRIGMSVDEAKKILESYGTVELTDNGNGWLNSKPGVGFVVYWEVQRPGVAALGKSDGVVRMALSDDRKFRTADGLVGADLSSEPAFDMMVKRYGDPTYSGQIVLGYLYVEWKAAGLGFVIELETDTIYSVSVFRPVER